MNHIGRFKAPFHVDSDSGRYIISPETLWHAPEGMEYIIEIQNSAGKWSVDSYKHTMLFTLEEAIPIAAQEFASHEGSIPVRVIRVGRWVGRKDSLLMVAVVKTFRTRKA